MPFLGRALYNLLQTKAQREDSHEAADWQIRDYRALSIEELFRGLSNLGLDMDVDQFEKAANEVEAPEDIAASIAPPGEPRNRVYLYLFELWRRLMDDRETISIFCDELDKTISAYEDDPVSNDEILYVSLKELIGILEQNVSLGQKPKILFAMISDFLSQDLESSIYNYIQDLIEQDRRMVASEITSNFAPYVEQTLWFDLLRVKLLHGATTEDTTAVMSLFLERLEQAKDLDLYFELLHYLNKTGHLELFERVFVNALELVKTGDEYVESLDILFEYYHLNDRKREEKIVKRILADKAKLQGEKKVTKKDKAIVEELVR